MKTHRIAPFQPSLPLSFLFLTPSLSLPPPPTSTLPPKHSLQPVHCKTSKLLENFLRLLSKPTESASSVLLYLHPSFSPRPPSSLPLTPLPKTHYHPPTASAAEPLLPAAMRRPSARLSRALFQKRPGAGCLSVVPLLAQNSSKDAKHISASSPPQLAQVPASRKVIRRNGRKRN